MPFSCLLGVPMLHSHQHPSQVHLHADNSLCASSPKGSCWAAPSKAKGKAKGKGKRKAESDAEPGQRACVTYYHLLI